MTSANWRRGSGARRVRRVARFRGLDIAGPGSLAVSTYQAGKVAMIGWDGRQATLLMRRIRQAAGHGGDRRPAWPWPRATICAFFANSPALGLRVSWKSSRGVTTRCYLPRATYYIGRPARPRRGISGERIIFGQRRVSPAWRTLGLDYSFTPFWKPSLRLPIWCRRTAAISTGWRCSTGGRSTSPRWGRRTRRAAWREKKATGGVLIDVDSGQVVLGGLSMPHSPRLHGGRIVAVELRAGELTTGRSASGRRSSSAACPDTLRGLCLVGHYALIGLSKIREKHIFGGLPDAGAAASRSVCGVAVVRSAPAAGWSGVFDFTAGCEELYDVQFLPGVFRPMILNLQKKPSARP